MLCNFLDTRPTEALQVPNLLVPLTYQCYWVKCGVIVGCVVCCFHQKMPVNLIVYYKRIHK